MKKLIEQRVNEFQASGFRGGWYTPYINGSLTTETIINSLSLVSMDLAVGDSLDQLTEKSLEQMWKRQLKSIIPSSNSGGFE